MEFSPELQTIVDEFGADTVISVPTENGVRRGTILEGLSQCEPMRTLPPEVLRVVLADLISKHQ